MADKNAFKEELDKDFIPTIERMVERQEEHIAFLKSRSKQPKYLKWLNHEAVHISEIIDSAENMLTHLKGRLKEYKEYSKGLTAQKSDSNEDH